MIRVKIKILVLACITLFVMSACEDTKEKSSAPAMKCGSGKCGANMFDGNSALEKKKKNILSQMREDDERKECVIKAKTTKMVYDCVRDPKTKKMSLKCGAEINPMKCSGQKCSGE